MVKTGTRSLQDVPAPRTYYQFSSRRLLVQQGSDVSELSDLHPYPDDTLPRISAVDYSAPTTFRTSVKAVAPAMTVSVPKEFENVPKLSADGANYRIWLARVKLAAGSCDDVGPELLERAPAADFFKKYLSETKVHVVLAGLKAEFGMPTAAAEAVTESRLFSLKCSDDRKLRQHLDDMREVNAITTSIPRSFSPVVTALATAIDISAEVIQALRREADSRAALKSSSSENPETPAIHFNMYCSISARHNTSGLNVR